MTINFQVDSLDGLDDSVKGLYAEKDGKFQLNVQGLPQAEDTTALKNALERQKANVTALKDKNASLSRFEQYADYEGIDDILPNLDQIVAKANAAGDPEGLERAQAKYKAELLKQNEKYTALEAENSSLKSSIKNTSIANDVRAAAIASGALPEKVDDLLALTRSHFDNADGETFVRDADGHPTGVSPKDWFSSVQLEQRPDYFKGSGASGSGARGTDGLPSKTMESANSQDEIRSILKQKKLVDIKAKLAKQKLNLKGFKNGFK